MKKLTTLLLALFMVFSLAGCGGATSDNTGSDTPAPADENPITNVAEYENNVLELGNATFTTNADGENIVKVEAVYTNKGSEGLYAMSAFAVRAFQNNAELVDCSDINGDEAALIQEVKDGASVMVTYVFKLADNSDVEVLIGEPTANQTTVGKMTYTVE